MYVSHFALRERPFRSTPDVARYYPATGHEEALALLLQGLAEEEGFLLLTGEPGVGKTLLSHCLMLRCGETRCVFLTNSHLTSRSALFQAILYDLCLSYEGRSEQELRLMLTEDLLGWVAQGGRTLLVVDEAHHLNLDLLEELRLLSNLESGGDRSLQVVLIAQPSLLEMLERAELASLRQRLAVRAILPPLTPDESADYLLHHLRAASEQPLTIVSEDALELIARRTQGIPRLLNQVAHRALMLACAGEAEQVDLEAALDALQALGLPGEADEEDEVSLPLGKVGELRRGQG